jgi:hypothetical protein
MSQPRLFVNAGMFRSGSTWSFNVAKRALAVSDPSRPVVHIYAEGPELDAILDTRSEEHRVVKCHNPTPRLLETLDDGTIDAMLFSQRDPLAALASCVSQFVKREPFSKDWDFERAVERTAGGIEFGARLRGHARVLVVDLHRDGEDDSLRAILAHLGIALTPAQFEGILGELSFEQMRHRSEAIARMPEESLQRGFSDPVTMMHAGHVEKGVDRDWTSELTPEQAMYASEMFFAAARPSKL